MINRKQFELRCGDKKWASLWVSDRGKILQHSLNEDEVKASPVLDVFDEHGRILILKDGGVGKVCLCDDGGIQLNLRYDDSDITDVVDPTGKVGLAVTFGGAGSGRNGNVIVYGDHLLRLQWLK
jgi:hypothetical protein